MVAPKATAKDAVETTMAQKGEQGYASNFRSLKEPIHFVTMVSGKTEKILKILKVETAKRARSSFFTATGNQVFSRSNKTRYPAPNVQRKSVKNSSTMLMNHTNTLVSVCVEK